MLFKLAPKRIHAKLFNSRPTSSWAKADSSEEGILRKELNKQRRHKPLRKLFSEIPMLILDLRPCLLMSPLTVSQFLDVERYQFDLVIFDEASQIPPEHAVGALMRAKQSIIVGDRKQLPPTRFFETLDSDADDEEEAGIEAAIFDSILDEADTNFPHKMLLWHYRSRDESLIAFSNRHFYASKLITFPSAVRQTPDSEKFLDFVYVPEGRYDRGGKRDNPLEAQKVVALITQHLRTNPALSLGVITFSQSQQSAIEILWEHELRENGELRALVTLNEANTGEPLFIKNLETVQGDERDLILFSVGYGKDSSGKMTMSFGPLNGNSGERRLNVAITRARQRIEFVSSIQPEDIDIRRTNSQGLKLLQDYMRLLRDGLQTLQAEVKVSDADHDLYFDSPFEEAVYDALTKRGFQLQTQIGVSGYRIDLAVIDSKMPGRYLLGIECDGATYHSAKTARERDRLRQEILERLGWQIHRIWSRSWFTDQAKEIEKIEAAIKRSLSTPQAANPAHLASAVSIGAVKTTDPTILAEKSLFPEPLLVTSPVAPSESTLPDWVEFYRVVKIAAYPIDLSESNPAILRILLDVVKQEGPIHTELAYKRIMTAFAVRRMGTKIEENLQKTVQVGVTRNQLKKQGDFIWLPEQQVFSVRVARIDSEKRAITYIPPQELELCLINLVQAALSLSEDDLITSAARIFGFARVGKDVRAKLQQTVETLVLNKRLVRLDDRIHLNH